MSDEPIVHERDGKIVYRASGIGGCLTALAAARQGMKKKGAYGKVVEVYEAGHRAEDRFFQLKPELNHFRQMEVVLHLTPKINIVGHLDAHNGGMHEVKSQSVEEWKKYRWNSWFNDPLWIKYSWQVSVCMLGLGTKKASVHRFNRVTEEIDTIELREPFWTREQVMERVMEIEALALEEELKCVTPSFFCDYPQLHGGAEIVEDDELEVAVAGYLRCKETADDANNNLKYFRDQISKLMQQYPNKVMLLSGHVISRSEFDTKDHMVKGSHQVRVTVTEAK